MNKEFPSFAWQEVESDDTVLRAVAYRTLCDLRPDVLAQSDDQTQELVRRAVVKMQGFEPNSVEVGQIIRAYDDAKAGKVAPEVAHWSAAEIEGHVSSVVDAYKAVAKPQPHAARQEETPWSQDRGQDTAIEYLLGALQLQLPQHYHPEFFRMTAALHAHLQQPEAEGRRALATVMEFLQGRLPTRYFTLDVGFYRERFKELKSRASGRSLLMENGLLEEGTIKRLDDFAAILAAHWPERIGERPSQEALAGSATKRRGGHAARRMRSSEGHRAAAARLDNGPDEQGPGEAIPGR